MERIEVLISKLQEQFNQKAEVKQMLVTVQLLQSELSKHQSGTQQILGTSKVSVMLPGTTNNAPVYASRDFEKYGPKTGVASPVVKEKEIAAEVKEQKEERQYGYTKNGAHPRKKEAGNLLFDPLVEIPTLSHQNGVKEINETVSARQESLNDKLKQQNFELGELLKGTPIKDLRKAIGINDRFVFISELFRGDEAMYERSVKTINSFNIFPESEYWINRELIVKLGWDQDSETVRHFYQLVKRRFS
ncbi:MAG: hypothetical protein JWM28_3694 [Chitinophagaceae bacterium]|nr:hypothetical protein [Chitinophagaceae bacterium]